jgi:hypothetical protein
MLVTTWFLCAGSTPLWCGSLPHIALLRGKHAPREHVHRGIHRRSVEVNGELKVLTQECLDSRDGHALLQKYLHIRGLRDL